MTPSLLFVIILLVHWLADFILQTHLQASNKSKNLIALLSHTFNYSIVWSIVILFVILPNLFDLFLFFLITFITHTLIDYFTSKQTAKLYAIQDYHNFFVIIGLDQILHYLQLWFTFQLLFGV